MSLYRRASVTNWHQLLFIRITSAKDWASEVVKMMGQSYALENGFFVTPIPNLVQCQCQAIFDFRTRLICANEMQTRKGNEAHEYL